MYTPLNGGSVRGPEAHREIRAFDVPAGRHTGREQRLHFRGEIQRAVVHGVEERLHAEAVAYGDELARAAVPDHERVLAAQPMHALRAEILVQVQRDLTIRARAQPVAAALEIALHALVVVELAVRDDPGGLVLVRDRLIAAREVDDAEARVPERDAAVGRDPGLLTVGAAMMQRAHGALQSLDGNLAALTKDRNDSAHLPCSPNGGLSRLQIKSTTSCASCLRSAHAPRVRTASARRFTRISACLCRSVEVLPVGLGLAPDRASTRRRPARPRSTTPSDSMQRSLNE